MVVLKPQDSEPTKPQENDIWLDSDSNEYKIVRNGKITIINKEEAEKLIEKLYIKTL